MEEKVKFNDLSGGLKFLIVMGGLTGCYIAFWFLVGIIQGIMIGGY